MDAYDIVIIGAGPVGLLLSVLLARWGYHIKHIDNRARPTETGRADGIQPRSLDLLKNLGLKRHLMAYNPALVYEVAFWDPSSTGIYRSGTWASCPKFIDARYPFTTLLHQGFIERVFISDLEANGVHVQRPWTITDFSNTGKDSQYPVEVSLARADGEMGTETIKCKYLFSGEGARSFVRQKLQIPVHHKDPISHVWGVMDGVVRTNFPDIKLKCTIHSNHGSIMVIPREDNKVRLYIQLASSTDADFNPRQTATAKEVQSKAQRILKPYSIEWETMDWYSVYPIGQGIAERYTLDERVFMGGDACHTHSPKAGQGMNTAFLDAQNFAWKLHLVESGVAKRDILTTYETERKHIAETLLDFDSRYARLFSARQPAKEEVGAASDLHSSSSDDKHENEFIKTFKESCEFTSGYGVTYQSNILNWNQDTHPAKSSFFLAYPAQTTQRSGRIMSPSTVTRVVDANVVHLEQEVPTNGAFRIYVYAGKPVNQHSVKVSLQNFGTALAQSHSFLSAHLRPAADQVSYHEKHLPHSRFFTFLTILASERSLVEIDAMLPPILARYRDHVYADDIWDARVPEAKAAAHAKMGLDQERGGVVVVRPDGYVACVVALDENGGGTVDALNDYFATFTTGKLGKEKDREDLLKAHI